MRIQLALPPVNPYVPESFDIKPLSDNDRHYPLVKCFLKICVSVGKSKVGQMIIVATASNIFSEHSAKKTKFKVISLPTEQGCTLRFGNDSEFDVEDGLAFLLSRLSK